MLDTGQIQLSGEALAWFRQGLAQSAVEQYEQAVAAYGKVLQLRPDFYEAWYERALALEHCGDYAEAIASFDRAIALRPERNALAEIWHNRGNALQYGLGNYEQAIAAYDEVLRLLPHHELAWHNRGNALLYGLAQPVGALQAYQRALHINAKNSLAWRNQGNALVELERHGEAIACYDRALVLNPSDEVARHARALACDRLGLDSYRQPTTQRVWPADGTPLDLHAPTYVEGDAGARELSSLPELPTELGSVSPGQPVLQVEDDLGLRDVVLDQPQYRIGRDPTNDICLHSKFVSRHHAVLTQIVKPDGSLVYEIVDGDLDGKASTNGILINAQRYRSAELCAGDVIIFGPGIRAMYRLV